MKEREKERERKRKRKRDRDRQTERDRQTDRQSVCVSNTTMLLLHLFLVWSSTKLKCVVRFTIAAK